MDCDAFLAAAWADHAADPARVAARLDGALASAMAAANLAERDTARAARLLRQAVDLASDSDLDAADPVHRALAVTGNNLACALEEKPDRSPAERDLMLLAAQTARTHWARAGGWLEIERAEYRLAMTWLAAGDRDRASVHAQACLDIIRANGDPAFERFFGWEAVGTVARAAGDTAGHGAALVHAAEALGELDASGLDASELAACRAALDRLQAP